MSGGDWLAASILAVFVLLSMLGMLKWMLRLSAGAILAALLLILLGSFPDLPGLSGTSRLLNDGRITPAFVDRAKQAAAVIGIDEHSRRSQEADPSQERFPAPESFREYRFDPDRLVTRPVGGGRAERPEATGR
jgi:hypothetical protein